MNQWLLIIPVISAMLGWFINYLLIKMVFHPRQPKKIVGFMWQGIVPKRRHQIANDISSFVSKEFFSLKDIGEKIASPESFKKILPQVEQHIDHFLRVKLSEAMPMISMFVGDRTITQLKTIFVAELEQLFPEIMRTYLVNLQEDINVEKMLAEKILSYPDEKLESIFLQAMKKEIRWVSFVGGVAGFMIGLIQVIITILISK